jgi:hypothetical protein
MANRKQKYNEGTNNADYENENAKENDYNYIEEQYPVNKQVMESIKDVKSKNEKSLKIANEQASINKKILISLTVLLILSICIGITALALVISQKNTLSQMGIY